MKGRISFLGNPWPEGHEIRDFRWSVERRGHDIWFGFHLVTANYYEERDIEDDENAKYHSDWEAPIVWGNYHSCTISSDEWHNGGFYACSAAEYNMQRIDGARFHIDPLPCDLSDDYEARAFHIYLLGHDAVVDHHIQLARISDTNLFKVVWMGKISLTYTGDYEPKYRFVAEIDNVPFPFVDAVASGLTLVP